MNPMKPFQKRIFWLVAVVSTLLLIPFLGETLFYSKGEPREAIVAYSMLESGNWILPLNYGTDIAYKPPFLYWCIAAVSWVAGGVSEFTSRLPSALAFLAMELVFFVFVTKRKTCVEALLASVLLFTSFEVHRAAVACRLDMMQVSLIVISICLLFQWDEAGRRRLPWLAIVLMACASLTKGPVGSIFPCLVVGALQVMRGQSFKRTFAQHTVIGLLSLVPLGLWFWAAYKQGGQAFADLMLEENTGRFFSTMSYASHENPLWYNFLTLIWGWLPWTLVLVLALFEVPWRELYLLLWDERLRLRLRVAWRKFRRQPPERLLAWLAIVLIFVFYCIPKSKRSVYLLPIYPFMARLLAEYLLVQSVFRARFIRVSAAIFATLGMLVTGFFIALRLKLVPEFTWSSGPFAFEDLLITDALRLTPLTPLDWLLALLPAVAAVLTFQVLTSKGQSVSLLSGTMGCILCLFVAFDGVYQPLVLSAKSDRYLAERVEKYVPEGPVYSFTTTNFYSVNYYLGDRMRHIVKERPEGKGWLLVPEKNEQAMREAIGQDYRLEKVFHTMGRSCDQRCPVIFYKFERKRPDAPAAPGPVSTPNPAKP